MSRGQLNKTITLAIIAAKMTVDPAKPCFVLCVTIDIAPTNVGSDNCNQALLRLERFYGRF